MDLDLAAPDHTTLSRRNRDVRLPTRRHDGPVHLIADSTGLEILGDGEWHRRKHKTRTRRTWRKLHIGVDADGFILASQLTESGLADASQVPELLDQVEEDLERFTGGGAYDTKGVYDAVASHQDGPEDVVIPPRKGAALSKKTSGAAKLRNDTVRGIKQLGRRRWKKGAGYHQQGRAENTFFRYKRILGGRLRAIVAESQEREALLACNVLNRMAELGLPEPHSIA